MNNFLAIIYIGLCLGVPVALVVAAVDVVNRPEHVSALYEQWQDMRHSSADRECTMGALQSSDQHLYYQLCMQQKGFKGASQ